MNREQMRDLLRRRLDEPTPDDFTDAMLDDILGMSLGRVQTRIMAYDPSAFVAINRKDLTAGQKFYDNPADYWHTYIVEVKDASSGQYSVVRPMQYVDTLVQTPGAQPVSDGLQRYARFGRKQIALFPVPTQNVADGLQHTYCQHLEMATDESVPDIPIALHLLIVLRGQLIAMGETHEDVKGLLAEIASLEGEIPSYYQRSGDTPETLPIDLGKDQSYGDGGYWRPFSNGIDIR